MERLAQLEPQEVFGMNTYAEQTEYANYAALVHNEFGALVWVDNQTGTFVSDRWKLSESLIKPKFKSFRSVRERWQVLDKTQERCECFRNREQAILFAQTCGW